MDGTTETRAVSLQWTRVSLFSFPSPSLPAGKQIRKIFRKRQWCVVLSGLHWWVNATKNSRNLPCIYPRLVCQRPDVQPNLGFRWVAGVHRVLRYYCLPQGQLPWQFLQWIKLFIENVQGITPTQKKKTNKNKTALYIVAIVVKLCRDLSCADTFLITFKNLFLSENN